MIRVLPILLVLLSVPAATAGWRVEAEEGMKSYTETHKVIAWSKDEMTAAIRSATKELVTLSNEDTGETKEQEMEFIFIPVRSCKNQKQIKKFPVVTSDKFSPADRKRGWNKVEKWLKRNRYTFVAGDKAKPAEIETATPGPAHATSEDNSAAGVIPLPKKMVPAKFASAHLEFVQLPEYPVLRLVVYPKGGGKPRVKILVKDVRVASTAEPVLGGWNYSPNGKCLVVHTKGPGPYASKPAGVHLLSMDVVKKALK
jgi:hypothetical protein